MCVLQSALAKFGAPASAAVSSAPSPAIGKRVGLVTLLLPDGGQQTYDAVLVGADRARGGCCSAAHSVVTGAGSVADVAWIGTHQVLHLRGSCQRLFHNSLCMRTVRLEKVGC
jgi:hypothetical protein